MPPTKPNTHSLLPYGNGPTGESLRTGLILYSGMRSPLTWVSEFPYHCSSWIRANTIGAIKCFRGRMILALLLAANNCKTSDPLSASIYYFSRCNSVESSVELWVPFESPAHKLQRNSIVHRCCFLWRKHYTIQRTDKRKSYIKSKSIHFGIGLYAFVGRGSEYIFSVADNGSDDKRGDSTAVKYISVLKTLRGLYLKNIDYKLVASDSESIGWALQITHCCQTAPDLNGRLVVTDNFYTRNGFARLVKNMTDGEMKTTGTVLLNNLDAKDRIFVKEPLARLLNTKSYRKVVLSCGRIETLSYSSQMILHIHHVGW